MRLFKAIVPIFTLGLLTVACRVDTPNGQIPSDYVNQAKALIGDYQGSMDEGQKGTLSIRMNGTKVVVKFSSKLLSCGGRLGDLLSIDADNSRLQSADLILTDASCVEGGTLSLVPSPDFKTFNAKVLLESHSESRCPASWEVLSCEQRASQKSSSCVAQASNANEIRLCIDLEYEEKNNCSACHSVTMSSYIYGAFKRK